MERKYRNKIHVFLQAKESIEFSEKVSLHSKARPSQNKCALCMCSARPSKVSSLMSILETVNTELSKNNDIHQIDNMFKTMGLKEQNPNDEEMTQ